MKKTIENRRSTATIIGLRAILYPLSSIFILLPGCMKETKPVAMVDKSPLIIDDAMLQRNWARSTVRFRNGETPAGSTGFVLQHPADAPIWTPILTDCPMFMANVAALPIAYFCTPPWTRVIYPAGVAEPSYTGVPPLSPAK